MGKEASSFESKVYNPKKSHKERLEALNVTHEKEVQTLTDKIEKVEEGHSSDKKRWAAE